MREGVLYHCTKSQPCDRFFGSEVEHMGSLRFVPGSLNSVQIKTDRCRFLIIHGENYIG